MAQNTWPGGVSVLMRSQVGAPVAAFDRDRSAVAQLVAGRVVGVDVDMAARVRGPCGCPRLAEGPFIRDRTRSMNCAGEIGGVLLGGDFGEDLRFAQLEGYGGAAH
jgi:hypothetical protein